MVNDVVLKRPICGLIASMECICSMRIEKNQDTVPLIRENLKGENCNEK